jgi:hypothetical protein
MESRSRTPTPIIVGEARKESRGYYSDSVDKRGARLPYRGQQKVDVPGLPFGMAAICALRPSIAPSSRGHRRKRAVEF